jgi:hypothetical protein
MVKVLISLGDWQVMEDMQAELVFASHSCLASTEGTNRRTEPFEYAWFFDDSKKACYHCDTPVPIEIQTLVILSRP